MVQPKVDAIREYRIKAGFSARGLALKAGIHYATITGMEKTGRNVNPATAKAICTALNVPFDELFVIKET